MYLFCILFSVKQAQILKAQAAKVALQSQLAVKSLHYSMLERRKPPLTPIQVSKGTFVNISGKLFLNSCSMIFSIHF